MRRLLIGAVLASASALWPFSSSEKQDPPTPHPDAVPVAQQTALPRLSNYDAVDEAFAEGGALVDEGGIVLDVDTASQAAAGFVGGQEWPSYVAATDVEPAAFVLKGINWSDQAPESVVKAARVASQALEKRKEALTKWWPKNRAFHTLRREPQNRGSSARSTSRCTKRPPKRKDVSRWAKATATWTASR